MVLQVPVIDETLGMRVYVSKTPGIYGIIREAIDDFVVEETLVDGSVAGVEGQAEKRALGATSQEQDYLLCVLIKRNLDTLGAVLRIAKELGISQSRIQIAGMKDARAVTAQHITIRGVSAKAVSGISVPGMEVRPLGYFRDGLAPFYLLGNKFRIRIRDIKKGANSAATRIAETVSQLESFGGIPNFFGHQRFGTRRPITHLVGKSIIKGDFETAAALFLAQTSQYEHPESAQARSELLATQDYKKALRDFPRQLRYERAMLSHLAVESKDFVGAFERLPQKLQELFVQAYQSYLFNLFLSERLRRGFSLNRAERGDFVLSLDRSGLPIARTGKTAGSESLAKTNILVESGRMRVALPLIGMRQKPSEGVMGEIQREILAKEGVEPKEFMVSARRIMSEKGELRPIVSPVKEFVVERIVSKEDVLNRFGAGLSFMLLRGSYATMLLREIMKPKDPVASGF